MAYNKGARLIHEFDSRSGFNGCGMKAACYKKEQQEMNKKKKKKKKKPKPEIVIDSWGENNDIVS